MISFKSYKSNFIKIILDKIDLPPRPRPIFKTMIKRILVMQLIFDIQCIFFTNLITKKTVLINKIKIRKQTLETIDSSEFASNKVLYSKKGKPLRKKIKGKPNRKKYERKQREKRLKFDAKTRA